MSRGLGDVYKRQAIRIDPSSALFAYPFSEAMLRSNRAAGQAGWYLVFLSLIHI